MGIFQSSLPHVFVEPLGFGFEDEYRAVSGDKVVVIQKPRSSVRTGACVHCLKRTKKMITVESNSLARYNGAVTSLTRSRKFYEASVSELKSSNEMLEWAALKHAESTELRDKAPRHLRQQLKDAHSRQRMAIERESHCAFRVLRKERAVVSTRTAHQNAMQRTVHAMNKQLQCSIRRSHQATIPVF